MWSHQPADALDGATTCSAGIREEDARERWEIETLVGQSGRDEDVGAFGARILEDGLAPRARHGAREQLHFHAGRGEEVAQRPAVVDAPRQHQAQVASPCLADKELDQTVVAEIKATSVDGRIEPGERQRIKDTAVAKVKGYLGAEGVEQMSRVLGIGNASLDGFIGSKVEAAVHDLRRTDPTRFNGASGGALPFPPAPAE